MNTSVLRPVVSQELLLLKRNAITWFRFLLFYVVFGAVIAVSAYRGDWEQLTITMVGLLILAAVGVSASLAGETFAQEKERGTMEALLLAPTSAAALVRAKLVFVVAAAATAVALSWVTGPILVLALSDSAHLVHVVNRATIFTALLACPPAILATAALGTIVSSRSRSIQNATTISAFTTMGSLPVAITGAYVLATGSTIAASAVAGAAWLAALLVYRAALTATSPQVMIRTRGG